LENLKSEIRAIPKPPEHLKILEEKLEKGKEKMLEKIEQKLFLGCENLCGDGVCQEVVCMAVGCPCPETPITCPEDCK